MPTALKTGATAHAQRGTANDPNGAATIGGSSAEVVPANDARCEVTVCNTHATQDAFLSLGATAVLNEGIFLKADGGSYSTGAYTGAINAIAEGAGTVLTFVDV